MTASDVEARWREVEDFPMDPRLELIADKTAEIIMREHLAEELQREPENKFWLGFWQLVLIGFAACIAVGTVAGLVLAWLSNG